MAFNHTYEEMLDAAYKELPKVDTAASRFEIPVVTGMVQGNRTIVKNLTKASAHLRRPLQHVLKFLLRELATTGEFKGSDAVFMGKFRPEFLNEKIVKYTKEFVLCDKCGKPDTKMKKERGLTFKHCEACGAKIAVRTLK